MKKTSTAPVSLPGAENLLPLADSLLGWYEKKARVLPWRSEPTPYRVLVSEVMLQQTRVEAVLPYFERFLRALPDLDALARADEPVLLKLWEGLGYYSRVRSLQKAARLALERYGGLPSSYELLLGLPGLGEYSAGAVASIAFGIPVPAVDGNVLRVLARLLDSREDTAKPGVRRAFRQAAADMLPQKRPGDFNQAMMELGAIICLPNAALKCEICPLREDCLARLSGSARTLPVKAPKKPRRIEERTVLAVLSPAGVLLHRRPEKGLLAGLLELPNTEGFLPEDGAAAFAANFGAAAEKIVRLRDAKHIFSHIEWRMRGFLLRSPFFPPPDWFLWADADALRDRCALPSAFSAYTDMLPKCMETAGTADD